MPPSERQNMRIMENDTLQLKTFDKPFVLRARLCCSFHLPSLAFPFRRPLELLPRHRTSASKFQRKDRVSLAL